MNVEIKKVRGFENPIENKDLLGNLGSNSVSGPGLSPGPSFKETLAKVASPGSSQDLPKMEGLKF